ncbi:MAG: DUF1501 domain-containing protein [Planctomycetaceae bacterium]
MRVHPMFRLLGEPKRLCTGLTRRDLLHVGGLGAFGVTLADRLAFPPAAHAEPQSLPGFGKARSCLLIYKYGSPPQHETFDPKPDAPVEIQGELKAIPSALPGVAIGAGLPRIAQIMDRLTVVRSLTHPYPLHGTVYATTGIPDVDTKIEAMPRHKRQWPFIGSIVDYLDEQRALRAGHAGLPALPRNIALPFVMGSKNEYPPLAGPYGAMLGQRYDPVYTDFRAEGTGLAPEINPGKAFRDPLLGIRPTDTLELAGTSAAGFDSARLDLRRNLLEQFQQGRRDLDRHERGAAFSLQQQQAFGLLSTGRMQQALDYTAEPMPVREAYGMTLFGQSCLAARRLIESGGRFVTVIWDAYGLNAGSWDTHHNPYGRLKEFLLPVFDQAFSTLILDLEQRGMLDETLVLVISEHGRTPQIDSKPRGAGRHHWSRAYSQVYAGGGLAPGAVIGRTDRHAGDVEATPVSPKDILATAFHLLGFDPDATVPDPEGRPMPLTGTGRVRPELLA